MSLKDCKHFFCDACRLGKLHKLPFAKPVVRVERKPEEFMDSDVCGPMQTPSLSGAEYFVTFKDDATAFRHVYFIKHKSDVLNKFIEFEKMLVDKFGRPMKTLRADNGGEQQEVRGLLSVTWDKNGKHGSLHTCIEWTCRERQSDDC